MASFRRLDSLELGLGFEDEPKNPPLNEVIRPLVKPSRLDCRKLAKALLGWKAFKILAGKFESWAEKIESWAGNFESWVENFESWAENLCWVVFEVGIFRIWFG